MFSDSFIVGGHIEYDLRPLQCEGGAGWDGGPEVFANFNAKCGVRSFEKEIGANRDNLSTQAYRLSS